MPSLGLEIVVPEWTVLCGRVQARRAGRHLVLLDDLGRYYRRVLQYCCLFARAEQLHKAGWIPMDTQVCSIQLDKVSNVVRLSGQFAVAYSGHPLLTR